VTFFNLTSTEIVLLVILALLVLGPRRLPHYAARLAQLVRQLRDLAEGAKGQIREEMGPAFDDIDWRQLDPRQYDPRRIVREALQEPSDTGRAAGASAAAGTGTAGVAAPAPALAGPGRAVGHDPSLPTPFDPDAT
jgi:sec-independent protein translocase protein TatB